MKKRTPQEIANFFEIETQVLFDEGIYFYIEDAEVGFLEIAEEMVNYDGVSDSQVFTPQTICTDCGGNGFVIGRNGRMGGHFCTTCHSTGWVDREESNGSR